MVALAARRMSYFANHKTGPLLLLLVFHSFWFLMVPLRAVGLSSLLYAIGVAASGVFPPIPPGVLGPCGPLPTDALCSTVFTTCNKTLVREQTYFFSVITEVLIFLA